MERKYIPTSTATWTVMDGDRVSVHGNARRASMLAWAGCSQGAENQADGLKALNLDPQQPVSILIKPIHSMDEKETFLDKDKLRELIIRAGELQELSPDKSFTHFLNSALALITQYLDQKNDRQEAMTLVEMWRQEGVEKIRKEEEEYSRAIKENPKLAEELPFE